MTEERKAPPPVVRVSLDGKSFGPTRPPTRAEIIPDVSYIIQLLEEISSKADILEERMDALMKSGLPRVVASDIPTPPVSPNYTSEKVEEEDNE